MRTRRLTLAVSLGLILCAPLLWAQDPDFAAMLRKVDSLNHFAGDFSAVYTVVAEKPGQETSVTQAQLFRRDAGNKFVLLILQPEVQKGQGYLQIDNNLWFYDPESRKFSHSSLKENFQSSDAKNSDFNKTSLADDYKVESWTEGTLGVYPVYILTLVGLTDTVTYPKMKVWIRKDLPIMLKTEDYSLSGRLMRSSYLPRYTRVGDNYVPAQMLFVDELNKGNRTQVTIGNPSIAPLPDSVYTKDFLERVNR